MTDRTDPSPATGGVTPSDPRLRKLFQALPRRRAPGEECPEPAELWASARGEIDPERNRWLIGHTGRCPSCAEDWRLARHLERGEGSAGAAGSAPAEADRVGRLQRFALAATVLLAVAVAVLWMAQGRLEEEAPVSRSDREDPIVALTPEDEPLSREDPVLRWRGPEGEEGVRYDIRVTTPSTLVVIDRAERLEDNEHRLPAEAIARLPPGAELRWQVEATLPDGSRIWSPAYRARLE